MMDSTYMTKFSGEINLADLDNDIREDVYSKLNTIISAKLHDVANLDKDTDILYIKGEIDNSEEIMEKLVYYISTVMVVDDDVVIQAQGQDPKDRWDLILKPDGVYIQEYKQVKGELRKYK